MHQLEARKVELLAEMASALRLSARVTLGRSEILGLVEEAVKDYRNLLSQQTTEARGILRELLVDRVLYTPTVRSGERWCEFTAQCSLGRILRGALDPNGG